MKKYYPADPVIMKFEDPMAVLYDERILLDYGRTLSSAITQERIVNNIVASSVIPQCTRLRPCGNTHSCPVCRGLLGFAVESLPHKYPQTPWNWFRAVLTLDGWSRVNGDVEPVNGTLDPRVRKFLDQIFQEIRCVKKETKNGPEYAYAAMQAHLRENRNGDFDKSFHVVMLIGNVSHQLVGNIMKKSMHDNISGGSLGLNQDDPSYWVSFASPYRKFDRKGRDFRLLSHELRELSLNLGYSDFKNEAVILRNIDFTISPRADYPNYSLTIKS